MTSWYEFRDRSVGKWQERAINPCPGFKCGSYIGAGWEEINEMRQFEFCIFYKILSNPLRLG